MGKKKMHPFNEGAKIYITNKNQIS